ncbi:MAG TPA: HDOD domain-containing protein [Myxococcota bacterium]
MVLNRLVRLFRSDDVAAVDDDDVFFKLVGQEVGGLDSRAPAVVDRLVDAVRTGKLRTPLLPQRALELIALTNARDVSFDALARIAVSDPTVAMTVMRVANSAAYASSSRATDVKDALVRLGVDGVRQVAFEIAMSSRVARRGRYLPVLDRIVRHGRTTSALARILARDLSIAPGPAALAGLLHATGGLVIVDELAGVRDHPPGDVVAFVLVRRLHPWVGAQLVGQLGLSHDVVDALQHHHDTPLAEQPVLTRLLAFVDSISPAEPAARVLPLAVALERSALPLTERVVLHRLQPILSTVDDVRESLSR